MAEHPWDEVKQKFNAALSLSATERELYLKQLSTESTQLHHEVADLLARHTDANENDFLASIKIGKQTAADLADTIAHMLPTVDIKSTVDDPESLCTISAEAKIDETSYIGEIGDYQLIEQIGRGGMGVVYKAYQKNVGRTVALKVIAGGSLSSAEDIARFHDEASAAGRLSHPGIVAVYDAGEHEGTHYFSMAYIEGENLASYVGPGKPRLKPKEAARLMEEVCRAVQYAHDHFVIHRDIKPANIMLDKSSQPLLADFGLAKLVGTEGYTQTGQTMGTPNYMAPEQAKGQLDLISNRTDVYSLGGTLYALLKGKPPIEGKNLLETLKKVESAVPETLYYRGSQIPLDLWIICEKCLAKKPDDRYQSAAALADDLQCFLNGFPISARAVGSGTHLVRWSQRNPLIATLIGTIAATLVIATLVSISFAVQARADRDRAEISQAHAEKNLGLIEEILEKVLVSMSESDLADVPGTQFVREKLLTTAQGYYEELSSTQQVDADMIARAAFPLGRLQASLGRFGDAQGSFGNVLAYQQKIARANPRDSAALSALGQTHYEYAKLGERIWNAGDSDDPSKDAENGLAMMVEHAAECIAWRTKAYEIDSRDGEIGRLVANAKMGLALGKIEQQRIDPQAPRRNEAEQLLNEAQSLRRKLLEEQPENGKVQADLAKGFIALADLRFAEARAIAPDVQGQESLLEQSVELRKQAIEIYENLPLDAITRDTQYDLANCYQACGTDHVTAKEYARAIEYYEKMGTTLNPLLLSNPGVYKFRKGVADAQYNLSQLYLLQSDNLGLDYVADFQKTLVNALIVDPRNDDAIDLLIAYSKNIAALLAASDFFPEAVNCLEQAKSLLNEAKSNTADPAIIEAAIEKLNEEIEAVRDKGKAANRTAWLCWEIASWPNA